MTMGKVNKIVVVCLAVLFLFSQFIAGCSGSIGSDPASGDSEIENGDVRWLWLAGAGFAFLLLFMVLWAKFGRNTGP